jgi:hypothetical protein
MSKSTAFAGHLQNAATSWARQGNLLSTSRAFSATAISTVDARSTILEEAIVSLTSTLDEKKKVAISRFKDMLAASVFEDRSDNLMLTEIAHLGHILLDVPEHAGREDESELKSVDGALASVWDATITTEKGNEDVDVKISVDGALASVWDATITTDKGSEDVDVKISIEGVQRGGYKFVTTKTRGARDSVILGFSSASVNASLVLLVNEIKDVLNTLPTPHTDVSLRHKVTRLTDHQLGALRHAGYRFWLTDLIDAASKADVRVLTWMRTQARFAHRDLAAYWSSDHVLAQLSESLSCYLPRGATTIRSDSVTLSEGLLRLLEHELRDVEACADLVFDRTYWTCAEDDVTFPVSIFLPAAIARNNDVAIAWFLNRAQFRYPLPRYFSTVADEQTVTTAIKVLAERGETHLATKLAEFVKKYTRTHQLTVRSRL